MAGLNREEALLIIDKAPDWKEVNPMNASSILLKAESVGVREFRDNASKIIKKHKPVVITAHGKKESVLVPFDDMLEIIEILDELQDERVIKLVSKARKSIADGSEGIPVFSGGTKIKKK